MVRHKVKGLLCQMTFQLTFYIRSDKLYNKIMPNEENFMLTRRELLKLIATGATSGAFLGNSVYSADNNQGSHKMKVSMINNDGKPMSEHSLHSLYSSDLHFEPIRRHSEIGTDGIVTIETPSKDFALHAHIGVPDFGFVWVTADNGGEGYDSADESIDFVLETAKSRLNDVKKITQTGAFSPECLAHIDACNEFLEIAKKKPDNTGFFHLKALSHALWAGEYAIVEKSRQIITESPSRKGFLFGCNTFAYKGDTPYADYFAKVLNFGTLPFYLASLEPEEGKPQYDRIDTILEWCEKVGIKPKGHPLWWGHQAGIPKWLEGASWQEAQKHCERVVGRSVDRYKGRINVWDVINEAHDWANGLNLTHEQEIEITRICCDTARSKDPNATIIVNNCCPFGEYAADGKVHLGPAYDRVYTPLSYLDDLMSAGVDFDVVGVQIYFPARDMLSISKLLGEYARFGKPIHITELGVRCVEPERQINESEQVRRTQGEWHYPWSEKVQADWMEWFYTVAYARKEIEAITWWDFGDPAFIPTSGFLYEDETPKEMYFRLKSLKEKMLK
jgi:endo-1,4-beta-xylanase